MSGQKRTDEDLGKMVSGITERLSGGGKWSGVEVKSRYLRVVVVEKCAPLL